MKKRTWLDDVFDEVNKEVSLWPPWRFTEETREAIAKQWRTTMVLNEKKQILMEVLSHLRASAGEIFSAFYSCPEKDREGIKNLGDLLAHTNKVLNRFNHIGADISYIRVNAKDREEDVRLGPNEVPLLNRKGLKVKF